MSEIEEAAEAAGTEPGAGSGSLAVDGITAAQGGAGEPPDLDGTGEPPGPGRSRSLRWLLEANLAVVTFWAVVSGLIVGAILIIVTTPSVLNAWGNVFSDPGHAFVKTFTVVFSAYQALFDGSIISPAALAHSISSGTGWTVVFTPISETLVSATPLIFAGTGVALGFATGVFNIGGQGQVITGALAATYVGFQVHAPMIIHLPLVVIAGAVGGAIAGFVPGILKATTGAHEVIVTIMLNYIILDLLAWLLSRSPFQQPGQSNSESKTIPPSARMPHLFGSGLRVNLGLILALLAALAIWWLMTRSTVGFTFRVIGANADAGKTAGMSSAKATTLVLTISGALVGLAGMSTVSGTDYFLSLSYGGTIGFDAITVALLGRNKPIGVVLGALLFAAFDSGARTMQATTNISSDLTSVVQAVIVFFVATPALVREVYRLREAGAGKIVLFTKGWGG